MKFTARIAIFLILILAGALCAAAGGSYTLSVGQSQVLSFTPREGGKGFAWSSSDPAAVEVTAQDGTTTATVAARRGTAQPVTVSCSYTVTVQGAGFSYENPVSEDFYISVPLEVTGLEIPTSLELYKGASHAFSPRVLPEGATTSISWSSDNPSVAAVDDSGVVRALAEGSAIITARAASGHTATCRVAVILPTVGLRCNINYSIVLPGSKLTLTATPADAAIRYTLDGSDPTPSSTLYGGTPIIIDRDLTLKAVATKADYYDSPMLVREYRLSDMAIESVFPAEGAELVRPGVVPVVSYSADICRGPAFDQIELHDISGRRINGSAAICGRTLFFIPDEDLAPADYTLGIPSRAVTSYAGDWVDDFSLAFAVAGAPVCKDVYAITDNAVEVLRADGMLLTWGYEPYLGDGSTGRKWTSTPLIIMNSIESISYLSAVRTDGSLLTWGSYCGDGTREERLVPVKIMDDVESVHRNVYSNLALKKDHTLWEWTSNILTPEKIMDNVKAVHLSDGYSFAIDENDDLYWWGRAGFNTTFPFEPTFTLSNVRSVSHYEGTVFAVCNDNTLWTWGRADGYILGDGSTAERTTPVKVMDNIASACVGSGQGYAIATDGSLWGWGSRNYGGLGDGSGESRRSPVKICDDVRSIHANFQSCHIIKTDGSLWGWGAIIGDGTRDTHLSPVKIADKVVQMYGTHAYAFYFTKDDGSLWGYGDDSNNIIGSGLKGPKLSPVLCIGVSAAEPASLSLSDAVAGIGNRVALQPQVLPEDAAYRTIEWSSSDEGVATVDGRGVVTGLADGEATLTATITSYAGRQLSASCRVRVYENAGLGIVETDRTPAVLTDGLTLSVDAPARILSAAGVELHRSAAATTRWTAPAPGIYIVLPASGLPRKVLLR